MADTPDSSIRLDQFLKRQRLVESGGQAKQFIQAGMVMVNGQLETRRRHKVRLGDVVQLDDIEITVTEDAVIPSVSQDDFAPPE